jgi:hypothetical protein
MSRLGEYLRAVRTRKFLSEERVQYRMEPTRIKVDKIEQHPEVVSTQVLTKYLKAIEITAEEYADFCNFLSLEFGVKLAKKWRENKAFRMVANVVRFESRAGIDSVRKKRLYLRRRQNGSQEGSV